MTSKEIESVLLQSRLYKCLPSKIIGIDEEDTYTAYCFNEACAYIMMKIENGDKPRYIERKKSNVKNYKTFTDFYKEFEK